MDKPPRQQPDPSFHAPIGALVIAVAELDSRMTDLLAALTGMNAPHALATVHHQQFASKVSTALAIINEDYQKQIDIFQPIIDIINEAKRISDRRNGLVHAYWIVFNGVTTAVKIEARGKIDFKPRQPSPAEIYNDVRRAHEISAYLHEWVDLLRDREASLQGRRAPKLEPR